MTYSRDERLELAALLEKTDPEAPTLCTGWQARDLIAHLVLRERRPYAAVGALGGPLAGFTDRQRQGYLDRYSYPELIRLFRSGPPRLSVFAIPGTDEMANAVEHFVHHEDVRRGAPGWTERDLAPGLSDLLWRRLGAARFFLRGAPTGVVLVREGGTAGKGSGLLVAKNATPSVTVTGTPAELTMWLMGRTSAANVAFDGPDEAVARLTAWRS